MFSLPTLNPDNELEYSWANWLIEHQQLYHEGKLNHIQKVYMEELAKKYNFQLQQSETDSFINNCQNFEEYMKTRQIN
jgi:hypothetical protein